MNTRLSYTSKREATVGYLFLLPTILILGTFNLGPAVYSLILSFFQWDGFSPSRQLVGMSHYLSLARSPEFWNAVRVTVQYALGVTLGGTVTGLLSAILLNQEIRGRWLYRILFFLPIVTPTVAIGVVWKYLLDPTQGVVNSFFHSVGLAGPSWLTDPFWAPISVICVGIWKRTGFNALVYLAALQGIPRTLTEAAEVDGARPWQVFWHVIHPMLKPATFFIVITSMIDAFQIFDLVYVMTEGGPMNATDVLGFYLYRYGFRYSMLGYASAVAYVVFFFIFTATLVQYYLNRRGGMVYE